MWVCIDVCHFVLVLNGSGPQGPSSRKCRCVKSIKDFFCLQMFPYMKQFTIYIKYINDHLSLLYFAYTLFLLFVICVFFCSSNFITALCAQTHPTNLFFFSHLVLSIGLWSLALSSSGLEWCLSKTDFDSHPFCCVRNVFNQCGYSCRAMQLTWNGNERWFILCHHQELQWKSPFNLLEWIYSKWIN